MELQEPLRRDARFVPIATAAEGVAYYGGQAAPSKGRRVTIGVSTRPAANSQRTNIESAPSPSARYIARTKVASSNPSSAVGDTPS